MFENCYPNTLDTTIEIGGATGHPDTFIITGDTDAMWLRDSSCPVWPYVPPAKNDGDLRGLCQGPIGRKARSTQLDPLCECPLFRIPSRRNHCFGL